MKNLVALVFALLFAVSCGTESEVSASSDGGVPSTPVVPANNGDGGTAPAGCTTRDDCWDSEAALCVRTDNQPGSCRYAPCDSCPGGWVCDTVANHCRPQPVDAGTACDRFACPAGFTCRATDSGGAACDPVSDAGVSTPADGGVLTPDAGVLSCEGVCPAGYTCQIDQARGLVVCTAPDAGVSMPDAGVVADAGVSTPDAGVQPECATLDQCADPQGAVCINGQCEYFFCSSNEGCNIGSSCDTSRGYCRRNPIVDAGTTQPDAGVTVADAGIQTPDAGVTQIDAGIIADGGNNTTIPPDAGAQASDAGVIPPDAGVTPADGGVTTGPTVPQGARGLVRITFSVSRLGQGCAASSAHIAAWGNVSNFSVPLENGTLSIDVPIYYDGTLNTTIHCIAHASGNIPGDYSQYGANGQTARQVGYSEVRFYFSGGGWQDLLDGAKTLNGKLVVPLNDPWSM